MLTAAVGDLHGAGAEGEALELVLGLGHRADGVEQVLGLDPPDVGVGEVPLVGGVALVPLGSTRWYVRELQMSRTSALRSYFDVGEPLAQLFEQLGVRRGVADAEVVDRLDDPRADEVGPDAVGERRGEPGVLRRGEPLGQDDAAVLAGDVGRLAAEELRLHHRAADGVVDLAAAGVEDDRLAVVLALLAADLREEGGEP